MTKVIIHIGTEKTGTTSIQKCLQQNRANLAKQGIIYPHIGPRDDAHFDLVNALHPLDNNGRYMEFLPEVEHEQDFYWDALARCITANPDKTIVLSAEHFSSRLRHKALSYMKAFFDKLNIEPDIVIYLRPQQGYIESSYSTSIKSGSDLTFSQAFDSHEQQIFRYDYHKLLGLWSSHFEQKSIIVRVYDKASLNGDVCTDFLSLIGVNDLNSLELATVHENKKWGPAMLEVARLVNMQAKGLPPYHRHKLLQKCEQLLPKAMPKAASIEGLITTKQMTEIEAFYKDSNQRVAKEYLNQDQLFIEQKLHQPLQETPVSISRQHLIRLMMAIFNDTHTD
ncbi:hypothetical protein [Shewanella sp. 6_MG-2023]|uniref:hypothetical protein n=1 Tax=Shewanella sp. 6_MG-2023 TaxID=3062660 RepID=UPI0026E1AA40|nr:hypothetical protein [Shewanella sp. 6_MG-2023]MDO6617645.1 hypothetical protein [Shewanella sp. 6_MG-2023]